VRLIVTGGSGFIGTRLVCRLHNLGHQVAVVDTVPCKARGAEMRLQSVLEPEGVRAAVTNADAVMHLAGPIRDGVRRDPYRGNLLQLHGTLNVLEACRLNSIPHILLASSFYVYNGLDEDILAGESAVLDLLRMETFGASKLMSEALCREYTRKYGLVHTILRLGSAYGAGGSNVIGAFIEAGLNGRALEVWGAGKRRSQYTFVDDLVDGFVASLGTVNETFNLCSPEVTTTACLAELLERELGFTVRFDRDRPEEANFPVIDSRNAMEKLGWRPTTLRDGLRRTVEEARRSLAEDPRRGGG